jgi:transketolase
MKVNNLHEQALAIGLSAKAIRLRERLLEVTRNAGRGHIGPALSILEIIDVLYDRVMQIAGPPRGQEWANRDRFILSKGHGCLGLYVVLEEKGLLEELDLSQFCTYESKFGGHPESAFIPAIEFSTGSLGHGLPVAAGIAKAGAMKKQNWRVFVLVGDGELNEGSNWEAAAHCVKHKLDNLVVIVDYNNMQASGLVQEVLDMRPLREKWEAFGFETFEVNGHDCVALEQVLNMKSNGLPRCVIAYTVKGKGIKIAENSSIWHHKAKITTQEIETLKADLYS